MTPEEKAAVGFRLAKVIAVFLNEESLSTNQEGVEILGIAVMSYHSLLLAAHTHGLEDKP